MLGGTSAAPPHANPRSTASAESASHQLNVGPITRIDLGTDVGSTAFGDGKLLVTSHGHNGDYSEIDAIDITTKRRSVVARTRFSPGSISSLAAIGAWAIYVDRQPYAGDDMSPVLWRVIAVNAPTHQTIGLASNGRAPDPFDPDIRTSNGYASWETRPQLAGHRVAPVRTFIWRPGWHHARQVPTRPHACSVAPTYAAAPSSVASKYLGSCIATDGSTIWTQKDPTSGLDDYSELWTQNPGEAPHQVFQSQTDMWPPYAANGLVAWSDTDNNAVIVQDVTDQTERRTFRGLPGGQGPIGEGNTFVFLSTRGPALRMIAETVTITRS
jgi:outer membrane protein assembly factor BamB